MKRGCLRYILRPLYQHQRIPRIGMKPFGNPRLPFLDNQHQRIPMIGMKHVTSSSDTRRVNQHQRIPMIGMKPSSQHRNSIHMLSAPKNPDDRDETVIINESFFHNYQHQRIPMIGMKLSDIFIIHWTFNQHQRIPMIGMKRCIFFNSYSKCISAPKNPDDRDETSVEFLPTQTNRISTKESRWSGWN